MRKEENRIRVLIEAGIWVPCSTRCTHGVVLFSAELLPCKAALLSIPMLFRWRRSMCCQSVGVSYRLPALLLSILLVLPEVLLVLPQFLLLFASNCRTTAEALICCVPHTQKIRQQELTSLFDSNWQLIERRKEKFKQKEWNRVLDFELKTLLKIRQSRGEHTKSPTPRKIKQDREVRFIEVIKRMIAQWRWSFVSSAVWTLPLSCQRVSLAGTIATLCTLRRTCLAFVPVMTSKKLRWLLARTGSMALAHADLEDRFF